MKISSTSERLKQILEERKIKQVDILRLAEPYCKKYGVKLNRNDLSQYVNNKVEPGQTKLYILGQALQVSEAWLMGYDVPMNGSSLASRLQQTMDEIDVTIGHLAELTGLSKETIIKYLQNDNVTPKRNEIKSICNALNINEAWLLGHQYIGKNRKAPATSGNQFEKEINEDWLDVLCEDETENSDLKILIKIAQTISPEKLKQLREMAQVMFPEAYCQ